MRNDVAAVESTFDSTGLRVASSIDGRTVERSFRPNGLLEQLIYPSGLTLGHEHDELDRLTTVRTVADGGVAQLPAMLAAYEYAGSERRSALTTASGKRVSWKLDALGRAARRSRSPAEGLRSSCATRLDRVVLREPRRRSGALRLRRARSARRGPGRRAAQRSGGSDRQRQDGGADRQQQIVALAQSRPASGPAREFEYDGAGNRLSATGDDGTSCVYDATGTLVSAGGVAVRTDAAGNVVDDGRFSYAYDFANRLARVTETALGEVRWSAEYDALGRAVHVSDAGGEFALTYDGNRAIEARDSDGSLRRTLVWGAAPDELLAVVDRETIELALPDLHGDVAAITDGAGAVRETYAYDVWGARAAAPDASVAQGYIGRPHVGGAPLVDVRARTLHTGFGRFLQRDPAGPIDGFDDHVYAGNNPLSYADRDGECATVVGGALGGAFGVGWAIGSIINAGIYELAGPNWGERWQGWAHYGSQIAQFTASGAAIGAGVDLAPVAGGLVSAGLMGAGVSGALAAPSGDWAGFAKDAGVGALTGVGFWGVGRFAIAPLAGWGAATGLGGSALAAGERLGGRLVASRVGSLVTGAIGWVQNGVAQLAENTWGNQVVSRLVGPAMQRHLNAALAGQGAPAADLALMQRIVNETMRDLETGATTWGGFQKAFWKAARQTDAFKQLFPNAVGAGAPIYGSLGKLNIHHLAGRIRDLKFFGSNLTLVPRVLDTPFVHSAAYLTGTQQPLIRRGLRALFPRQWTNGSLGALVGDLLPGWSEPAAAPPAGCR